MNKKFLDLISKMKEPELFLGVCRILKVKIYEGEEPKDFIVLLEEALEAFKATPRKRRKELLKIMEAAVE